MSHTNEYVEPTHLWNKSFIAVLAMGLCTGIAAQTVVALMAKFALSIGASLTVAGTVAAMMSLIAIVCRPIGGMTTDRFNCKYVMLVSTLILGVCVACYSLCREMVSLFALRIIHGISFSFMSIASMSFGSAFVPKERMGEGIGYLGLGSLISSAVGTNIGLSICENYGFVAVFLFSGLLELIAVALIATIPYQEPPHTRRTKKFSIEDVLSTKILLYMGIIAILSCGNGLASSYLALIGDERGIVNVGLFFTAYSVFAVVLRPLIGKLMDRKGLRFVLIPAIVFSSAGMLLLGMAQSTWMVVAAGCCKALGQGAASPSIQAYAIKLLGRERVGVASGTCLIGSDIGNAAAPIVGSLIASAYGFTAMFYAFAVFLLVGASLLLFVQCRIEKKRGIACA